jgi:hypothetical protein
MVNVRELTTSKIISSTHHANAPRGMHMIESKWLQKWGSVVITCAGLTAAGHAGAIDSQPTGIDPQVQRILRRSTDFLAAQTRFSADTRSTIEVVLTSGQKLQFSNRVTMSVKRPDKLWARRYGDYIDQVFYYDGQTLTLHNPAQKVYASVAVPASIEGMLDFARTKLDIIAPLGDFLYSNAYDILTDGVTSAFLVGRSYVEGVRCVHLAFRAPQADWQIWIEDGERPLPRKVVITTRDIVNAPQFDVTVTRWDLSPRSDDRRFAFRPQAGDSSTEFLPPAVSSPTGK